MDTLLLPSYLAHDVERKTAVKPSCEGLGSYEELLDAARDLKHTVTHCYWTGSDDFFPIAEQAFGWPTTVSMFHDEFLVPTEEPGPRVWVRKRTPMGCEKCVAEYYKIAVLAEMGNGTILSQERVDASAGIPNETIGQFKVLRFSYTDAYVDVVRYSDKTYSYVLTTCSEATFRLANTNGFLHGESKITSYLQEHRPEHPLIGKLPTRHTSNAAAALPQPLFSDMDQCWLSIPGNEEERFRFLDELQENFVGDSEECLEVFGYRTHDSWISAVHQFLAKMGPTPSQAAHATYPAFIRLCESYISLPTTRGITFSTPNSTTLTDAAALRRYQPQPRENLTIDI